MTFDITVVVRYALEKLKTLKNWQNLGIHEKKN